MKKVVVFFFFLLFSQSVQAKQKSWVKKLENAIYKEKVAKLEKLESHAQITYSERTDLLSLIEEKRKQGWKYAVALNRVFIEAPIDRKEIDSKYDKMKAVINNIKIREQH